MEKINR